MIFHRSRHMFICAKKQIFQINIERLKIQIFTTILNKMDKAQAEGETCGDREHKPVSEFL